MQEAEYDLTQQAIGGGQAPNAGTRVRFFYRPVKDHEASAEQGRPIFKDTEFVSLQAAGDRSNIVERPVRPADRQRYAGLYRQFKESSAQTDTGTPLAEWPLISKGQIEELRFFGVTTVEQLAAMADSTAQKFVGLTSIRQKALAYLDAAKGAAPIAKLQEQLDAKDLELTTLKNQMAEVLVRLNKADEEEDE